MGVPEGPRGGPGEGPAALVGSVGSLVRKVMMVLVHQILTVTSKKALKPGLGSFFGWGAPPPPGGDGDFGPDGIPDEQPSGGMAFFFGGPDKGGYMPPGMDGRRW